VERSQANHEQETRDEIGFLLIHQGSPTFFSRHFGALHVNPLRTFRSVRIPASGTQRGSDLAG